MHKIKDKKIFHKFCFSILLLFFSAYSAAGNMVPTKTFDEIRKSASLRDGDILYIDFWASWCNPCRKSFPWMNAMVKKYGAKGFKVLAINVDKDRALAAKFLGITDTTFPIYYDPDGNLAKQFKLKGMPSSFIFDADGTLLTAHKGFFEDQITAYEHEIQSLLTQ